MAHIAVAHADLTAKGGGEALCANVLEALQGVHEVTLLTLAPADLSELNRHFRTEIRAVDVRRPRWAGASLSRLDGPVLSRLDGPRRGLRNALLNRFVADRRDEFDLVVGTDNELSVAGPLIQYVHAPRFVRPAVTKRVGEDGFRDHAYDRLCWRLGGFDPDRIRESTLLVGSERAADVVQDAYDVRPRVVRPPVDVQEFEDRPWDERESGFVSVRHSARDGNLLGAVEIVDRLRDRDHDVHLHLVGPGYDESAREVRRAASEREHVRVEGELPREKLAELVSTHRYGLGGDRRDRLGIAVAELAAGGTVPFAPDDRGNRETAGSDDLTYSTTDEAVEKIDYVLSNPDLARTLRRGTADVEERFGRRRFHRELRELAAEALDEERTIPVVEA